MNKILIISQETLETTTEEVIDWIVYKGHQFERMNGDSLGKNDLDFYIGNGNDCNRLNFYFGREQLNNYYSIWFRRWQYMNHSIEKLRVKMKDSKTSINLAYDLLNSISSDESSISYYIIKSIKSKIRLTSLGQNNVNKIECLDLAKEEGILIPDYLITNKKNYLIDFYRKNKSVIVKDIQNPFLHYGEDNTMLNYVSLISESDISSFPEIFPITFFQKYIDKKYEIRTFFLNGTFYSMAIYSQGSEKTKIDFRNYDMERPNRNVPYKLPSQIESNLSSLMKKLNLQTGSIDLIKSIDGSYYFLEVNPVGQFGMVSHPCNYNLEKKVAEFLCQ